MKRRALLPLLLFALAAPPAPAEPLPRERVPEPLRPWIDWALRGHESELCPSFLGSDDESRCAWPGRLVLDLGEKAGKWSQTWDVQVPGFVPLPGEAARWPLDVQVDGRPAAAIPHDDGPALWLLPGRHTVAGAFRWDALPESLPVPAETGLVALTVRGAAVPFPERDEEGRLFLQRETPQAGEAERLEIKVERRLVDEVPLLLTTRIELAVSGKAREALLGRALPDGFIPLSLDGPLPARLEPDGRLRVQARPGTWTLALTARHAGPVAALTLPSPGGPWSDEEVWVFEARPGLRVADVLGVPAVDPQQTALPDDWKKLPAYRLRPGDTLRLAERRRGDADPPPDQLTLRRVLWLDFDGGGYTWQDQLAGTLTRGWRLEMAPPSRLERAVIAGRDQVITERGTSPLAGVEVRQGQVLLAAEGRLPGRFALPAVGWDHDFQAVSGELHLPPGWRLFAATGVDQAPGTWVGRWTLLDLFLVLLIALAVRHLWGTRWGALALLALVLTWQEPDAPQWIWIAVLATAALLPLLPAGRLRSFVRLLAAASRIGLALIAIAFLVQHLRQAIHPALEYPYTAVEGQGELPDRTVQASLGKIPVAGGLSGSADLVEGALGEAAGDLKALGYLGARKKMRKIPSSPPPPPAPPPQPVVSAPVEREEPATIPKPEYPAVTREPLQDVDPRAVVNTGPGLPAWTWNRVELRWSGPVDKGQQVHLFLLGPFANFVLAFLSAALLVLLALRACGVTALPSGWRRPPAAGGILAAALLLATLLLPSSAAAAEVPPADVLDKLREALTEKPACAPECAASPRLFLDASPAGLRLRFEVGAAAAVAVPIPGGTEQWVPAEVQVDGAPAAVVRSADGRLWVRLAPGRHEIAASGPLPPRDVVQLPLPLKPHRVEATASGWTVDGIHEDGQADDSLQLSRVERGGPAAAEGLRPGALPPFLEVERTLHLGLTWVVDTRVRRRSPLGAPAVAAVPLLPAESVTTAGVRVEKGAVLVSLAPQAAEAAWSSTLAPRPELRLAAPRTLAWTEVWRLDASPLWHVDLRGIPPVHAAEVPAMRVPEWRPWPGESVTLAISRPAGVAGQSLTVDRTLLAVTPGLRSTEARLELSARSSRGGRHTIVLPDRAALLAVEIDGQAQPIHQEGRQVTLPIHPGAQKILLVWREDRGASPFFRTAAVDLKIPSVNALVTVANPAGRWILLLGGPPLGPAVLFWSLLLVIVLVAIALGRLPLTPLRTSHWALLGVGLSQVPLTAAALVAGWLLALGARRKKGAEIARVKTFDLLQILLVLWTLVALSTLFWAIQQGLLGTPEMQIAGNGSSAGDLHWYADRAGEILPRAWIVSVPLLVYRLAMLAWALWLALALLGWLRWGWESLTTGGGWRPWRRRKGKV